MLLDVVQDKLFLVIGCCESSLSLSVCSVSSSVGIRGWEWLSSSEPESASSFIHQYIASGPAIQGSGMCVLMAAYMTSDPFDSWHLIRGID